MNIINKIVCPICSKKNTWQKENPYRPFCSERCRLLDLGEWASENYRVVAKDKTEDMSEDTDQE